MPPIHSIDIDPNMAREISGGWQLKVNVLDLGMYINGFRALKKKDNSGWWVQPPSRKVGNTWKNVVEFNKSERLWQEIEVKVLDFIAEAERNKNLDINQVGEGAAQKQLLDNIDNIFPGNKKVGGSSNE